MYEDTKLMLEHAAAEQAKADFKYRKERLSAVSEAADRNAIWDKLSSRNDDVNDYLSFRQELTDAYVTEGLVVFVDNCLPSHLVTEDYHQKLVRQLVTNFVKEEGSAKLLRKFKSTSYVMSEMAYIIESTINSIIEDAKDKETFKPEKKDKEEFYKKLEKVDVEEAIDKITSRVREQEQTFMNNNMEEKAALASALSKTEQKVAANKEKLAEKMNSEKAQETAAKLEEAYIAEGKRKMADIRSSRSKNVLECMIYNLSKTAMVNESAGRVFIENSKLNMDKIVEHCTTMLTFLTAMDSLKIIDVNEAYIEQMLKDMKA